MKNTKLSQFHFIKQILMEILKGISIRKLLKAIIIIYNNYIFIKLKLETRKVNIKLINYINIYVICY